jgi:hypothetical protein
MVITLCNIIQILLVGDRSNPDRKMFSRLLCQPLRAMDDIVTAYLVN